MKHEPFDSYPSTTLTATRLVGVAFALFIAVLLAAFILPVPSFADDGPYLQGDKVSPDDSAAGLAQDGIPAIQLLDTADGIPDYIDSDLDIKFAGFVTSGAYCNQQANVAPGSPEAIPEDATNVFLFGTAEPISRQSTYCFLIFTDTGTYFIGRPYDIEDESDSDFGEYYSLDKNTYKKDLLFYSPTTLEEQLEESPYINSDIVDILTSLEKVTDENIDTIPFPDPSTYSESNPTTFLANLLIYDGPSLPEDFDLSNPRNIGLYRSSCFAPFTVSSTNQLISKQMVWGSFGDDEDEDNLTKAGPATTYLDIPEINNEVNVALYEGEDSGEPQLTSWCVPVGSTLDFTSWIDNDTYIATGAVLVHYDDPANSQAISDVSFYREYVDFTYTVPDYEYMTAITELAPYPGEYGFLDVAQGTWYHDVVEQAVFLGYVHGYNGWFFGPNDNITRGQIATVLFNMSGWTVEDYNVNKELGDNAPSFPDVTEADYFYKPVEWAVANGLVSGYSIPGGNVFGPNDDATREQLMTIICAYAKLAQGADFKGLSADEVDEQLAKFPDGNQVSDWAKDAVAWCIASGVEIGYIDAQGTALLLPQAPITRAETTAMAVRLQPNDLISPLGL